MADNKGGALLGDAEYERFKRWLGDTGRGIIPNKLGITETAQYKEFKKKLPVTQLTPYAAEILRKKGIMPKEAEVAPTPIAQLTPYAAGILEQTGGVPPKVSIARPEGMPSVQERRQIKEALEAATGAETLEADIPLPEGMPETYTNAAGQVMRWDPSRGDYIQIGFDPEKVYRPEEEPEAMPPGMFATYEEAVAASPTGYIPTQTADGWWRLQWQDPTQQPGYISPYQEQYLGIQQQQLEAQKQAQLAQLRANPASWLEYASLAGETPTVQPWMLPLMPQQYGGLQVGQALPGYQAEGAKMGLPKLTTPSRQYQARMSPSQWGQYGGYERARTGQTLSDIDWRQWQSAPPSGSFSGLSRLR